MSVLRREQRIPTDGDVKGGKTMSSKTRPKETEHLKSRLSYIEPVVRLESWAALPANRPGHRDAPGLCRRCAPARNVHGPGRPRPSSLVASIGSATSINRTLSEPHSQEQSLRESAGSKSAGRNVDSHGQSIVNHQLQRQHPPNSGLGRHGENGSLRKLLDGQDQQCGRCAQSDAQPGTRRAIRPDVANMSCR